jgi:hypothetical protein
MKRLIFLFALVLITVSCEKTKTQDPEIPSWVQDRINHDEEIIKSDPKSGLDIAAWIRYEYKSKLYYEYLNLLSSAGPEIYQYDGTKFDNTEIDIFDYQSKKCCRYYIWKGPSYIDIYD